MQAAVAKFFRDYKFAWPIIALFVTSLFTHAAGHRIVFYALVPFMIYLLYQAKDQVKRFVRTKSFVLLVAYLGYFWLTFFWSEPQSTWGFFKVLRDAAGIGVFSLSLALAIPNTKFNPRLPVYFAAVCCVFAAISMATFYNRPEMTLAWRLVGEGRYENSIHFSFLMSFAVLGLICLGFKGTPKEIAVRVGLMLLLLFFVTLSQTRSAFVCLAACVAMVAVVGDKRSAIVICVLGLICAAIGYQMWNGSNGIFERLDSYRFGIWQEAWQGVIAHPLLGNGIETEPKFLPELRFSNGGWKSTHNVYLGHLFTGGIIGLAIFMAMVANMIWIAASQWWHEKKNGAVSYLTMLSSLWLCFALVSGLFLFTHYIENVHIHWLVFWVVYAMLWSIEVNRKVAP